MAQIRVTSERRLGIVRDMCREFSDLASRTIAKKLYAQHPKLFKSLEVARSSVRICRGNAGAANRKSGVADKSLYRQSGSQSDRPPLPKSLSKPWEPYVLDAARVLVLSDIHLPHHDELAVELALEHGDEFEPDAILLNGDTLDFEAISKFDKPIGASIKDELVVGRQFLAHLRHRFPAAKIVLKRGNHEERWDTYFWRKAIELEELCRDVWQHFLGTEDYGVEVIGDQRPIMCGKLMVLHGHEKGRGMQSSVNPARGAFLRLMCSTLEGHGHRTSEHTERTADGRVIACRSSGCLCDLHPAYARLNRWDQSFATVEVAADGDYECRLHRIVNGKVR